jgi:hypothetical protein
MIVLVYHVQLTVLVAQVLDLALVMGVHVIHLFCWKIIF